MSCCIPLHFRLQDLDVFASYQCTSFVSVCMSFSLMLLWWDFDFCIFVSSIAHTYPNPCGVALRQEDRMVLCDGL